MTKICSSLAAIILLMACAPESPEVQQDRVESGVVQYKLPKALTEISGLAAADDTSVFAVADEEAVIFRIDALSGEVRGRFRFGQNFSESFLVEGVLAGEVVLVDSDGTLYFGDADVDSVPRIVATGVGEQCEVEGLATLANSLLMVCKTARAKSVKKTLTWFVWSDGETPRRVSVPMNEVSQMVGLNKANASAIDVLADGRLIVLFARQSAFAIVTTQGEVVHGGQLPKAFKHRQSEGVAVLPGGVLVVGDEGGSKRGRLTVYADGLM